VSTLRPGTFRDGGRSRISTRLMPSPRQHGRVRHRIPLRSAGYGSTAIKRPYACTSGRHIRDEASAEHAADAAHDDGSRGAGGEYCGPDGVWCTYSDGHNDLGQDRDARFGSELRTCVRPPGWSVVIPNRSLERLVLVEQRFVLAGEPWIRPPERPREDPMHVHPKWRATQSALAQAGPRAIGRSRQPRSSRQSSAAINVDRYPRRGRRRRSRAPGCSGSTNERQHRTDRFDFG
jgi:hypothetical protein